jgi:20S proteasome subunit beta 6
LSISSALLCSAPDQWSPYTNNGGTVVAIAGSDYCIVAGDTRLSDGGYGILSRKQSKLHSLTPYTILATSGMFADMQTLQKVLDYKLTQYQHKHHKLMSTEASAQLLSNTLYYKRFFPYYTFNLLAGIDQNGVGVVYAYDAIGSFERLTYGAEGTGMKLVVPILDNQVAYKTHQTNSRELPLHEALDLIKDVLTSAGERDIYTGDDVDIAIITKDGTKWEKFPLKKD